MEEITLLDAIQQMWHHRAKRKKIVFEVTFEEGITRRAYFGKVWSQVRKEWTYIIQDGVHDPQFGYDEKAVVSAIMSISGMRLQRNVVKYHIHRYL